MKPLERSVTIFCSIASTANRFRALWLTVLARQLLFSHSLLVGPFALHIPLSTTHRPRSLPTDRIRSHIRAPSTNPRKQSEQNVRFRQSHRPGHRHCRRPAYCGILLAQGASSLPLLPEGVLHSSPQPPACERTRGPDSGSGITTSDTHFDSIGHDIHVTFVTTSPPC